MTFVPEVAVFSRANGAIMHITTRANAPAATDPKLGTIALPAGYSEETWDWNAASRGFVENAAKVERVLVAAIKDEAELPRCRWRRPGG